MEFHVYETGETIRAARRPIVIINLEQREGTARRLPAPVLLPLHQVPRRRDPEGDRGGALSRHQAPPRGGGPAVFLETREVPGLKKKPSTSELLDWLKLLVSEDVAPETLRERDGRKLIPPLHGAS